MERIAQQTEFLFLKPEREPTVCRKYVNTVLAAYRSKSTFLKLPRKPKNCIALIFIAVICVYSFIYLMYTTNSFGELSRNLNHLPKGYLVYTGYCKIPNYNPNSKIRLLMEFFTKHKYVECLPTKKPITRLVRNQQTQSVHVIIDDDAKIEMFGNKPILCCYSEISRGRGGIIDFDDKDFDATKCIPFNHSLHLPSYVEYLIVECHISVITWTKEIDSMYLNMHFVVRKRAAVEERMERLAKKHSKKPLSVLLIGIDSFSRLQLVRSMPRTKNYLFNNYWFELMGYNNINDKTFPNLMAILTGYNVSTTYAKCDPNMFGKLDTCPLVWKDFYDNGYTTAYGEDEASRATFHRFNHGFLKQPTDYYMRPFLLAAELKLPYKTINGFTYCLGYTHYANYIFDYAIDFARTYAKQPHFGLFWINTFGHFIQSDSSPMDLKILHYLHELNETGVLNESMVIFFSDHGIRGAVQDTKIDWFDERLPFMFISLPQWFQTKYPKFVASLSVNQNRLTNPYDIHMTLKHIIKISSPAYAAQNGNYSADGCEQCQSIFYDVPRNRSCSDVNIESLWCTCARDI